MKATINKTSKCTRPPSDSGNRLSESGTQSSSPGTAPTSCRRTQNTLPVSPAVSDDELDDLPEPLLGISLSRYFFQGDSMTIKQASIRQEEYLLRSAVLDHEHIGSVFPWSDDCLRIHAVVANSDNRPLACAIGQKVFSVLRHEERTVDGQSVCALMRPLPARSAHLVPWMPVVRPVTYPSR